MLLLLSHSAWLNENKNISFYIIVIDTGICAYEGKRAGVNVGNKPQINFLFLGYARIKGNQEALKNYEYVI